jgi:hypothetical protein
MTRKEREGWIFPWSQIKQQFEDQEFYAKLNSTNKRSRKSKEKFWRSFQELPRQWKSGKLQWNGVGPNITKMCYVFVTSLKINFLY